MSDTSINQIIQYGTAAARAAYTPAPPAGIKTLYIWYDTDVAPNTYIWNGAAWVIINSGAGLGITALTTDVTATGPGSVAATIANAAVTPAKASTALKTRKLTFVFGDGVNTLAANVKSRLTCPWTGTITQSRIFSDAAAGGTTAVDIWKDTWANYPPTVGDTITASAKPTLASTDTHNEDTTLTGWTTSVTAGDVFFGNLDSVVTCKQVVVELIISLS